MAVAGVDRLGGKSAMSKKIRCLATVLVLALLMTAGAAQAQSSRAQPGSSGFFDALWQWLAGRYAPGLAALWEKEGSNMDPNGLTNKEGGDMDPDGRARLFVTPPPGTEAGGDMDPNGHS
jgi:hypothetical protein